MTESKAQGKHIPNVHFRVTTKLLEAFSKREKNSLASFSSVTPWTLSHRLNVAKPNRLESMRLRLPIPPWQPYLDLFLLVPVQNHYNSLAAPSRFFSTE